MGEFILPQIIFYTTKMKKILHIIIVLSLLSVNAIAQDGGKTIVDEINSSKWGKGNVTVMQDEAIQGEVAVRQEADIAFQKVGAIDPNADYEKVRGFKIQVYSGNNQQRSKREAESRRAQVKEAFPELEADVKFQSPFWRLRVGNFLTREDALLVLQEMKKALPGLAKEMYEVADEVKRPINK